MNERNLSSKYGTLLFANDLKLYLSIMSIEDVKTCENVIFLLSQMSVLYICKSFKV